MNSLRSRTASCSSVVVIGAYCRFDTQYGAESVLRGFIHQLLAQRPGLLPLVRKYYDERRLQRAGPQYRDVIQILNILVASLDGAHIVVDGLDELANDNEKTTLLQELQKLPARILIFSRPLELHLEHLPSATIFSIEARDQDIDQFIESSLRNHRRLKRSVVASNSSLVRELTVTMRKRCKGM